MAETEEPQFSSVKERIAALKLQQVGQTPPPAAAATGRSGGGVGSSDHAGVAVRKLRTPPPPPPPPPRPATPPRTFCMGIAKGRTSSGGSLASSSGGSLGGSLGGSGRGLNGTSRASLALTGVGDGSGSVRRSSAGMGLRKGVVGGSDGASGEEKRPTLPPRRQVTGASTTSATHTAAAPPVLPPPLPSRRGTAASATGAIAERDGMPRKGSFESISSVRSGRSSLSMRSVSTANTGYCGSSEHSGRVLKAPPFNPSLPAPCALAGDGEEGIEDDGSGKGGAPLQQGMLDHQDYKGRRDSAGGEINGGVRYERPPLPARPRSQHHVPNGYGDAVAAKLAKAVPAAVGLSTPPPPLPPSRLKQGLSLPVPITTPSRPHTNAIPDVQVNRSASNNDYESSSSSSTSECLLCRDFLAADEHAARFPRSSVPNGDLAWLAHQLSAPFPSLTDKARAIFTWMHHNITYDTEAYFSGASKRSTATPASTFQTGLAVCAGYAGLYNTLATNAGLECIKISGHSKGFGFKSPSSSSTAAIPAYKSTHAWNAVRIDGGRWKLIDSTWGAGHIDSSTNRYVKQFDSKMFTMDNEEFGLRHFTTEPAHFFLSEDPKYGGEGGGMMVSSPPSWESYILADALDKPEKVKVFGKARGENGIEPRSFVPAERRICLASLGVGEAGTVRFAFHKICPHWESERQGFGKPYLFLLALGQKNKDYVPFESDGSGSGSSGYWSWCDVDVDRLRDVLRVAAGGAGGTDGAAGGADGKADGGVKISLYALTRLGEMDGRGVTKEEYLEKKGRVGMSFDVLAQWVLV